MEKVYPQMWMALSKEERNILVKQFDIKRTGITEIRDSTVISDGYMQRDLDVITKEAMMKFVGQDVPLSFIRLWELTLNKVESIIFPPPAEIATTMSENSVRTKEENKKKLDSTAETSTK